jgi:hypothetical protein
VIAKGGRRDLNEFGVHLYIGNGFGRDHGRQSKILLDDRCSIFAGNFRKPGLPATTAWPVAALDPLPTFGPCA